MKCNQCKKERNKKEFYVYKGVTRKRCRSCVNENNKKYPSMKYTIEKQRRKNSSVFGVYRTIKYRSQKKGIPLLNFEEFKEWYLCTPKQCFYCDIPEKIAISHPVFSKGSNGVFSRLSIDKVDPIVGYISKNMVLSCFICNMIKGYFLSSVETREIGQKYVKPRWLESGPPIISSLI